MDGREPAKLPAENEGGGVPPFLFRYSSFLASLSKSIYGRGAREERGPC